MMEPADEAKEVHRNDEKRHIEHEALDVTALGFPTISVIATIPTLLIESRPSKFLLNQSYNPLFRQLLSIT